MAPIHLTTKVWARECLIFANQKLALLQSREWRMRFNGRDVKVRDQIDRIANVLDACKNVGDGVAALDPLHAGLPWAGVCVILTVW